MVTIRKEIKEEVIAKVKTGGKVAEIAEQYGISRKTVYNWLMKESGGDQVSILKYNRLKRENEELKKLIGELTLDVSLGKKKRVG